MRKELFKSLITLSIPTMIEQILSTLLQYVDTAMVGQLGEQATAAVSVTTTITWLTHSIPMSVGVAALALISRGIGMQDQEMIRSVSKQVLLLVAACGVVIGGVSVLLSPYIPRWMGAEKAIWHDASMYFTIISIPMLFRCSNMVLASVIRATKDTRTPMVINLVSNGVNIVLNYLLIYVVGLGVMGAALGSAVSYIFSGTAMFVAYRRKKILYWKWKQFSVDVRRICSMMKIALPVLATSLVSCLGYIVFAGLVSGMGTTVFAAHSIAVNAETLFYIAGYGLRSATSTLVGISLGEGDRKKFETVSLLSIAMTVGMMTLNGVLLYLTANPLMHLLTSSNKAAAPGADMLRLIAFTEPFYGLMIVMEGIYYGLGKTRYVFWVESAAMWGPRIFVTALGVLYWNFDLTAVWYCMIADNLCKAFLLAIPFAVKRSDMVEWKES